MTGIRSLFASKEPRNQASFVQRYHYTISGLFEQSVDVYRPLGDHCRDDLVVLLTVGSGWMGHQPYIYRACAWWNASGPQTLAAALQCPCVCIRHRGAYFALPDDWLTILKYCLLPLGGMSAALCTYELWTLAWSVPALVLLFCVWLKWSAHGSASLDDMVDDVATAIAWVDQNRDKVLPAPKDSSTTPSNCHFAFGGYSSGGHVSGMLLQRPAEYWKGHGLPPPHLLFAVIVYISGVLAVQPFSINGKDDDDDAPTARTMYSSSRPSGQSGSFSSDDESGAEEDQRQELSQQPFLMLMNDLVISNRTTSTPPVWLTNLVCRTVWGPKWQQELSSPLNELAKEEKLGSDLVRHKIPHLLIENRQEVFFGLPWLDVFFCARAYQQRLQELDVPVTLRLVDSDHWNILASRDLYQAVQDELPKMLKEKYGPK